MRYGADAADPLCQDQRALDGPSFGRFLDPEMRVEESGLEIEHELAHPAEAEVARLDDPGVDRPDRDLDDPLAVHAGHGHIVMHDAGDPGAPSEVLAQWMHSMRPIGMEDQPARVRVSLRVEAEEILGLTFVPVRRGNERRDGGERRVRWIEHRADRDVAA